MNTALEDWQAELGERLAGLYRNLHEHPELSTQEHRTADKVAAAMAAAGYEVFTGVGGTGVVGLLRNGPGPRVMLRADMDALPVEEKTGLPYASTCRGVDPDGNDVPVMHACGHDMHMACLVGAAELLAKSADTWRGTVLAVFQPAEELGVGAADMVGDGFFERFGAPDIVLGQHVTRLPAGVIGFREGPVMAGLDSARIELFGRGGHGGLPELTVDPVLMAASVVMRFQGIVAREIAPHESVVVTVGRLRAGTKDNVIPDAAELGVTVRAYTEQMREVARGAVERIVRAEAAASGAPREPLITWNQALPVLVSDVDATRRTLAEFRGHFGAERVRPMPVIAASEDLGTFGAAAGIPTVFWFWGGIDADVVATTPPRELPGNHSPYFAPVLEPTLGTGVEALTVAALAWLGAPPGHQQTCDR